MTILAQLSSDVADHVFETAQHREWRPRSNSAASREITDELWGERDGFESPIRWGYNVCQLRLAIACDYLSGLSVVLRADKLHAWAFSPLARSTLDTCSRTCWLLEPHLNTSERGCRMLAEWIAETRWQSRIADSEIPVEAINRFRRLADELGIELTSHRRTGAPAGVRGVPYPSLKDVSSLAVSPSDTKSSAAVHTYLAGMSHGSPQAAMAAISVRWDEGSAGAGAAGVGVIQLDESRVSSEVALAAAALVRTFDMYSVQMGWHRHAATNRARDSLVERIEEVLSRVR